MLTHKTHYKVKAGRVQTLARRQFNEGILRSVNVNQGKWWKMNMTEGR